MHGIEWPGVYDQIKVPVVYALGRPGGAGCRKMHTVGWSGGRAGYEKWSPGSPLLDAQKYTLLSGRGGAGYET